MIKTLLWLILVGFLMIALLIYWPYLMPSERKALRLLKLCKTLEIRMSKTDVIKLMGEPFYQKTENDLEYYYFLSPRVASEPTRIVLRNDKISGIACGEGYGVYEPTTQTTTSTK